MTKPLSERLEALLREHRETMAADVLMSWARDALVEMSEAAALARRVEGAAVAKVRGKVGDVCMVPVSHDYCGQRVRLVPEVGS